ncbi:MAG: glycosyltransferase family 1 protein [Lachnospiraceae bacterium]|nr:glycosyltransferase family 1 protein [Lachnospiraceae bacterium]
MKILYFSPTPYQDIKQRPQHLAEELSKYHELWYVDPTVSGMRCLKADGIHCNAYQYDVNPNLHVLRLNGLLAAHIKLQYYDKFSLNTWFEKQQLKALLASVDVIWLGYEACYRLLYPFRFHTRQHHRPLLVYDKMDDNVSLEQHPSIRKFLLKMRTFLEQDADVIFVTASLFWETLSSKRPNVFLVQNGVGLEDYLLNPLLPSGKKTERAKHYGYIGMMGHWFDHDLIRSFALSFPECNVSLVGPLATERITLPNVHYHGVVPKNQVYHWIEQFDACLYPFKKGPLLDTIDPVKIYEYLLLNKPVIASDSKEMDKYKGLIYTYKSQEEFLQICGKEGLALPFSSEKERTLFFQKNSWEERAGHILDVIEGLAK